jgi:hypothetical protein
VSIGKLCWYLVPFRDGKLDKHGIRTVARLEEDGVDHFVVQAHSAVEAAKLAWRKYQLRDSRRRRAAYLAEGRCQWCGREQDRKPGQRCSVCHDALKGYRKRANAKARGEEVPPPDTLATRKRNRELERADIERSIRAAVLDEVRMAWARAEDVDTFARWLRAEILKARGKAVA